MASEEGLKILLKGEVQDFLKDFKSVKDAIINTTSTAAQAAKKLLGLSGAAEEASNSAEDLSKSLKEETAAANAAGQANANVGKFIRQMTFERKAALIQLRNGNTSWKLESQAVENVIPKYQKLQGQTVRTGAVLTGLNRIVQDAPFGYIAIQNNITELFTSYQTLTKTLGSSQAAFKAVASSLIGAGGIGFAFSTVTSLVTVAVQKYGSIEKAILAASGAFDKQAQIQDALNKSIAEGLGGIQGEITKVQSLTKVILDESQSRKTRTNALQELKKEYPGYFDQVELDKSLTVSLTTAQAELIKVLKRHGRAKAILAQIEKNYTEILAVQNKSVIESASGWQKFASLVINGGNTAAVASELATQGAQNQKKAIDDLNKSNDNLIKQYDELLKQDAISDTLGDPTKIETVAGILKELSSSLAATDAQAKSFGGTASELAKEKITALSRAFDSLVKLGLKPTSPELKNIASQISALKGVISGGLISKVLQTLQSELAATDAQAKLFGGTADNLAQEKIKALNKAFDDLVKLGLKPTSPELKKVADQINFLSASILGVKPLDTKFLRPLGKAVKTTKVKPLTADELKKILGLDFKSELQIDPKVQIEPIFQTTPGLENLNKFSKQFTARMGQLSKSASKEFNKNFIILGDALDFTSISPAIVDLGNQLRSAFAGISEGIGDALGNILTGKATLASALGSLVGIMGDFIVQFGKSLVQAATLRIIAEKALIANPYLALAAGIGAIAIGTALKNSVPRFATGGVVNGPTLAMVGDNPSGVEYMIPKEVLDRLGGGDNMEVFGRFQLAGTDLVASITRTRREEARTR